MVSQLITHILEHISYLFSNNEVNDLRLGSVIRHRYVDFTFVYRPLLLSALLRFSFGETMLCKLEVTISSFFM